MTAELHGAAFHAQSLGWAERYSEARHQLTTLLDAARRLGSPTILAFALATLPKSAGGAASGRRPMLMRPRRCNGRLRTASLACSATASACWHASKQHVVSANSAKPELTRRSVKSNLEALAACRVWLLARAGRTRRG